MLAFSACNSNKETAQTTLSGLDPQNFVSEYEGKPTALYTLKNANGMEVCVTNFGGRIVSIMVPDRNGDFKDVVLGFDSVQAYFPQNNLSDFGASIGRYANRINQGKIVIDGDTIQLPKNNFGHCLHGGPSGWQYKVYEANQLNDSTLVLTMDSPDGDNNFPGNVKATVTYTLLSDNAIDIDYKATTDKTTVINMTNHSYFNLNGNPNEPITNNILTVNAARYTPVDSTYMTTGEIVEVKDTPMDFTAAKVVGEDIDKFEFVQLKNGNGYDHNWVLDAAGDDSQVAATLLSPSTGIQLDVYTNEPGIQVYSGNFLDGTQTGKHGIIYNQRTGICLETQKYPDTPNKPEWPSALLKPGETYNSHCVFKFSTVK
ncbi:MAG: galactose mutarotase [Muribaculaceae bacterium]|nr:galactose mutarotase [Muribaculaceae bacterium]